jgi:hypothetical protein
MSICTACGDWSNPYIWEHIALVESDLLAAAELALTDETLTTLTQWVERVESLTSATRRDIVHALIHTRARLNNPNYPEWW